MCGHSLWALILPVPWNLMHWITGTNYLHASDKWKASCTVGSIVHVHCSHFITSFKPVANKSWLICNLLSVLSVLTYYLWFYIFLSTWFPSALKSSSWGKILGKYFILINICCKFCICFVNPFLYLYEIICSNELLKKNVKNNLRLSNV